MDYVEYGAKHDLKFNTTGERALWQACIAQHIRDLFIQSESRKSKRIKRQAAKFLIYDTEVYEFICILAGFDAKTLRKKCKILYNKISQSKLAFKSYMKKVSSGHFDIVKFANN
jgi:hypothetical protein